MKLAWICYEHDGLWGKEKKAIIVFVEPERYKYHTIIPIVYAEIVEHEAD